jgi:predicted nicotinamide N-methyase
MADAACYEDAFDAGLFVCEDYVDVTVAGGVTLRASTAACTDFDLTGQVVWPAAHLLADYVTSPAGRAVVAGAAVLELGAGVGVAGAAAAVAGAASVLLTDGEDVVTRLLAVNAARMQAATGASVRVARLDWGSPADRAAVRAAAPASPAGPGWPVVLGADVAYSVGALEALFGAVAACLGSGGVALIGYVSRSGLLDRGLPAAATAAGLSSVEVAGTRRGVGGGLVGWVVRCERG